jgi:hypothetical protein
MSNVKPIVVVYYLPEAISPPSGRIIPVYEVNTEVRNLFPDYLTLAVPSRMSLDGSCEDIRLEVFHPKDFTEIQYEELKTLLEAKLEQLKPTTNE